MSPGSHGSPRKEALEDVWLSELFWLLGMGVLLAISLDFRPWRFPPGADRLREEVSESEKSRPDHQK